MLQIEQGGKGTLGRDVMLQTVKGKVVGGERRDVTDSARVKGVVRERRDVPDIPSEKCSFARDVILRTM